MKTIANIGEFGLIDRIQQFLPTVNQSNIIIGIGDDTAVIKIDENRSMLITCDIQIEDQHFRRQHIQPYQLGRRAMAVNLSDIAAMGGKPTYALVSLGLPKSFPVRQFDELYTGMRDQLADFGAFIIGGNLSNSEDKIIIDITLMGEIDQSNLLSRSGADIGDRVFITNVVGYSAIGYYILQKYGTGYPKEFEKYVSAHLQPVPRVVAGQHIARAGIASSMIDISDGIASDLNHICTASKAGARIDKKKIPVPVNYRQIESVTGKFCIDLALNGGEDYELLFTVKPGIADNIIEAVSGNCHIQFVEIGCIVDQQNGLVLVDENDNSNPVYPGGWDHFGE